MIAPVGVKSTQPTSTTSSTAPTSTTSSSLTAKATGSTPDKYLGTRSSGEEIPQRCLGTRSSGEEIPQTRCSVGGVSSFSLTAADFSVA
jgi:hypothetical protein